MFDARRINSSLNFNGGKTSGPAKGPRHSRRNRADKSAILARPAKRLEHPAVVVTLIERRPAAELQCGVALPKRRLAVAGAREPRVGIGVARAAVGVGVALGVHGEG